MSITGALSGLIIVVSILCFFRKLVNQRAAARGRLVFVMVLIYALCCLPFSLNKALKAYFPQSESIFNHPSMFTILYIFCVIQFSLNFCVYTLMPESLREAHINLWKNLSFSLKQLVKHFPPGHLLQSHAVESTRPVLKSFKSTQEDQTFEFILTSKYSVPKIETNDTRC